MASRTYQNDTGVRVTRQNLRDVLEAAHAILDAEILVGVPREKTDREDGEAFNNASRAYVHDQGAPEVGIPQREFMRPGIEDAMPLIEKGLGMAMKAAMRGNALEAEQRMHQVGIVAQSAIRKRIDEGVPPPLADYTVRKRAMRGRKGALLEMDRRDEMRRLGEDPLFDAEASMNLVKPLIDKGEMRKSITYVIRSRKKRR